eukprot:CAMPEP_0117040176 /NCGR_PEP_ID=MMETSP0472-20121206/28137_1 /TAXON_ID=693140 ORGANISM="Tiarina fusus, Strain LIS" /NCGR_SAMPLE_ID=MMETSP0472 /ASSEMBLY_ACC=CAM_ASM_000603 /LENGTH=52 /DNA_ID=CAMNT_0004750845 /DNA_START=155 /DNA_END=313 /DNA_ORIENTATION=-
MDRENLDDTPPGEDENGDFEHMEPEDDNNEMDDVGYTVENLKELKNAGENDL